LASTTDTVRIHYHRPPDRQDLYVQKLLDRTADCIVTFMPETPLDAPLVVADEIVLENGAPAIWFTFPGAWHDIGRFHRRDGTFTGVYANAITPVRFLDASTWETTDLFLDFWRSATGTTCMLDEDEFEEAVRRDWVDAVSADRASTEMASIARLCGAGSWPPPIVAAWPLERVRAVVRGTSP
jgi:predicted RNA-binding protein associated with RNAse of E/G family